VRRPGFETKVVFGDATSRFANSGENGGAARWTAGRFVSEMGSSGEAERTYRNGERGGLAGIADGTVRGL